MRTKDTMECDGSYHAPMSFTDTSGTIAWCREALRQCGPCEWVILGYLGVLNLMLLVFHGRLPGAERYFLLHIAVGAAILTLARAPGQWPSAALRFVRHWYAFALFIFFFEELHYIVHLIFSGWYDHWLIAFDFALLGVHPTVWMESIVSPAATDWMAFFYLTYYFYTVILAGVLYARKELQSFWVVMTSTAVAYVMGYLIALVFPIEGPYHTLRALQHAPLEGGPVTALMNFIQCFGRVHGAAFPSLHVAGSFVALLGTWKFARRLFWVFLPLFAAMCISTVYGRYHYVGDIFGGLIVGAAGFWIGQKWEIIETRAI